MLRERGQYVLKLQNGDSVTFKFNTYCFLKFCEISGNLTYAQMLDLLANGLSIQAVINLLKSASGKYELEDSEVSEWIDEMGGLSGAKFVEVIQTATEALIDKGQEGAKKKK